MQRPAQALPTGTCDCHAHVLAGQIPAYHAMIDAVGLSRGVLVQTSISPADQTTMLQAIADRPALLRGVGIAGADVSDAELDRLHAAGVRGLRFVEMPNPAGAGRFPGTIGTEHLARMAPRLRERGWHAEIWAPGAFIAREADALVRLGVPLVFNHLGLVDLAQGTDSPALAVLCRLLRDGSGWVKLTVCRASQLFPDYPDVRPIHDALLAANPRRLLWGSDWPHIRMGDRTPAVGHLVDLFHDWVADADLRQTILVANPAALYGFPA